MTSSVTIRALLRLAYLDLYDITPCNGGSKVNGGLIEEYIAFKSYPKLGYESQLT